MNEESKIEKLRTHFAELIELMEKHRAIDPIDQFGNLQRFLNGRSQREKMLVFSVFVLLFSVALVYFLSSDQFIYDIYFLCLAVCRTIFIQILPFWDWTQIYKTTCLVANPFFNDSMSRLECDSCLNTTEVSRLSNVTFMNFTKQIYQNHLPVIVDDATESWKAVQQFNVEQLFQLFSKDPILSEHDLCRFQSNLRQYDRVGGADKLFQDFLNGRRRSFLVQWNNCHRETSKFLRSFYSKPYFLPSSIGQTLLENWLLISVGMDKEKVQAQPIPRGAAWSWIAQIEGRTLIKFQNESPCDTICPPVKSIKLNKGDLLVYSYLYNVSYLPLTKETILMAQGFE